ncbi:NAD(P)H-dependent oxidoreductase [Rhodoplanes sp. TEM]|uniref:NAD(P)H-dependent oxidoreductase n=1 Tax=Rhodoplanes tepidamans TaxID=200616 RepID=A0ABT5J969_RHOTP|nr:MULTISPECIES: NAD(P)H-dependent oxidoreductase [Rhodoplanes]MDC7785946.1 NAD(P)H-dependent oxidoreductase [Rhodoplanes tepidamans]MDC7986242.1 NAD(P)H-dependent oxidoreductase [Rhodoplanes sp. TEM]MDQ0355435.1 FMN reductase [Rhodoplanes tepidamans]
MSRIVAFVGNYQRPSKTRNLTEYVMRQVGARYGVTGPIYDLLDIVTPAGIALQRDDLSPEAQAILNEIEGANAVVFASPVYKGSYSGMFKHVIDLLRPDCLARKPILIAASGGGDRHALVVEHAMRPLFGFFAAHTVATAVYASERHFAQGELVAPEIVARVDAAITDLAPWLGREQH